MFFIYTANSRNQRKKDSADQTKSKEEKSSKYEIINFGYV